MTCRRVPFAEKAPCWLFAAGLFTLLTALVLLVHVSPWRGAEAERNDLYAQVLGVVRQWGSCPTCHTVAGNTPLVEQTTLTLVHRPVEWPAAPSQRGHTPPAAALNSQVVEVGQRLLGLLPSGDPQVERAAEEFLAVTRTLGDSPDAPHQASALQRLMQLEGVLRDLQAASAATTFWGAPSPAQPDHLSLVALLSSPAPLMALLVVSALILTEIRPLAGNPGSEIAPVPSLVTQAISRRGPPAVALVAILDSALKKIAAPWACNLLFCAPCWSGCVEVSADSPMSEAQKERSIV